MTLTQKKRIRELQAPGDYCKVAPPAIALCCPFCGLLMVCSHQIVSEKPLTLTPSIVGPHNADQHEDCGHHFYIEQGQVRAA